MKLMKGILSFVKSKKGVAAASCFLALNGSMTAFAAAPYEVSSAAPAASSSFLDSLPTVTITPELLRPLVDAVVNNIYPVLSVGIPVLGLLLALRVIPFLLSKFSGS